LSQAVQGYRKKPTWIYGIAAVYFLLPVLSLWQFFVQLDYSPPLLKEILFSNFFLVELFCSVTAGIAVLIVSRLSFFYLILLSVYTMVFKLYHLRTHAFLEHPVDLIVVLVWFGITSLFLFTALKIPYLNPKTRWWKQDRRFSFMSPGTILFDKTDLPVMVLNLSKGGAFVRLDEGLKPDTSLFPKKLGEELSVQIKVLPSAESLFEKGILKSRAKVVWIARPDTDYRHSLGLQFLNQAKPEKKALIKYLELVKKRGVEEEGRK
jgi:hypothetical protein